jgi:DNA-directed RNA polymerase subunit N (RpoN/RPB10)
MDLLALYNQTKADKGRTPKPMKDWKKKILNPSAPKDEWDFSNINDESATKRAQFYSAFEETELCYIIQPVHCVQCGWQHDEHWGIFLHEVHREQSSTTRFTRVQKSLGNYFHLPRRTIHNSPIKSPACNRCFETPCTSQLELPLDTIDAVTIGHLADALVQVEVMHEAHMKWKERKQPEHYGFDDPDSDTDTGHFIKKVKDSNEFKAVDELNW